MRLTERIQSRKFLLAISACVYFGLFHQYASIAQVVVAYLAVQAAQDALNDWQESRTTATPTPVSPAPTGDDEEVSGWTGSVI